MAPGIVPAAISPRMKSPARCNLSDEKLARVGETDCALPPLGQPAAIARTRSESDATRPRRQARPSVLDCFINRDSPDAHLCYDAFSSRAPVSTSLETLQSARIVSIFAA